MGIINFIERISVQTAVYWDNPVDDGYGGYTFDTAVEISCRWESTTEVIKTINGEDIICVAKVLVTQELDDQGWLYLGELDDSQMDSNPQPKDVQGSYQIVRNNKIPLLRSTDEFVYTVYLSSRRGL